jgi:hypothetical protein
MVYICVVVRLTTTGSSLANFFRRTTSESFSAFSTTTLKVLAGVSRYHTHLGAFKVRPKTNELNEICLQCNRSNSFVLTVAPTSDTMHGPSLLKQLLSPHDAVLFSFRHLSDGQNICQYDASRTRWYDLVRITFFRLHFLSPSSQTLCMLLFHFGLEHLATACLSPGRHVGGKS